MKKLLFLLAFPLFFSSCSSDDEKEALGKQDEQAKVEIVGAWNMKSASIREIEVADKAIETIIRDSISHKISDRYSFLTNGEFYYFEDGKHVSVFDLYSIRNGTLAISANKQSKEFTDLLINNDKMVFTYNAAMDFSTIVNKKVDKVIINFIYQREKK